MKDKIIVVDFVNKQMFPVFPMLKKVLAISQGMSLFSIPFFSMLTNKEFRKGKLFFLLNKSLMLIKPDAYYYKNLVCLDLFDKVV